MIRIDAVWLAVHPIDMRAGAGRLLASVVHVFGAAQAHHGYLFANARASRIKPLVHDGFGVWCAARRLNKGAFEWPRGGAIDAPVNLRKADLIKVGQTDRASLRMGPQRFDLLAPALKGRRRNLFFEAVASTLPNQPTFLELAHVGADVDWLDPRYRLGAAAARGALSDRSRTQCARH